MRESFVLYTTFYDALKFLSDEQLGKVFRAIFEYQTSGKEDVDNDIRIAFIFIKNQLDIDRKKYEDVSNKRKNAINKRWGKTLSGQDANLCFVLQNDNVYEYVSDNDREYMHLCDQDVTQMGEGMAETETQSVKVPLLETDESYDRNFYGIYGNVRLSDLELMQLKDMFPDDYQIKIDNLSTYMETTGKVYTNHYAVLIKWAGEDMKKEKSNGKSKKKYSFTDMDNHSYSDADFENMFDNFTDEEEEKIQIEN